MSLAARPRTRAERRHPYRVNRRIVYALELALDAARHGRQEATLALLGRALEEITIKTRPGSSPGEEAEA